jgi:peptidoglycan/xylan/chitin deacetylase (PgdA/CDA1 family)
MGRRPFQQMRGLSFDSKHDINPAIRYGALGGGRGPLQGRVSMRGMQSIRALFPNVFAFALFASAFWASAAASPALAQECPGKADALGTSRVLMLGPGEPTRVGSMQYPQSLPLADKEVVLTFDDGPLPPYSNQVLDILAEQCVKVTYFLVGEMARSYPDVVRRIYQEAHTIGTHTEDHPLRMHKLPVEKIRWEIDQGIADVTAALGDPNKLAPFIRIPGLDRSDVIEAEAAARSLVIFSTDTVADDWHRHIKPRDIVSRAMTRLEKRGRGILLLHDIHKSTVAALPELLKELKEKGFRVVHVISGETPGRIETVGEPLPTSVPPMPADLADASGAAYRAGTAAVEWPAPSAAAAPTDETELPAPDAQNLDIKDFGAADARIGWPRSTASSLSFRSHAHRTLVASRSARVRTALRKLRKFGNGKHV